MILEDLYTIKKSFKEPSRHVLHLLIDKDHKIYKGHFPNRPVTPGVVLLYFFKLQAETFTGKSLQLSRADNVKFLSVFDPSHQDLLELESEFEISDNFIKIKGLARAEGKILMKISALYKVV